MAYKMRPSIAIIIPARNEAQHIGACLRSIGGPPSYSQWSSSEYRDGEATGNPTKGAADPMSASRYVSEYGETAGNPPKRIAEKGTPPHPIFFQKMNSQQDVYPFKENGRTQEAEISKEVNTQPPADILKTERERTSRYAHFHQNRLGTQIEIIVIDDGSTDETGAIARRLGATVIRTEGIGPSAARNKAMRETDAEFCLFLDADCELEPGCLGQLVAVMEKAAPDVVSVGGRQEAPLDAPAYAQRVHRFLQAVGFMSEYGRGPEPSCSSQTSTLSSHALVYPIRLAFSRIRRAAVGTEELRGPFGSSSWPDSSSDNPDHGIDLSSSEAHLRSSCSLRQPVRESEIMAFETNHNPSCCALVRRKAVLEVGGFRENLWPCEDLELDMRLRHAGYRLLYVPTAVVRHQRPETPAGFSRMMRNYGRGHAHLVKMYGPRRLMHLVPLLTITTAGLAPLAALGTAPLWFAWRLRHNPQAFREIPALTWMLAQALAAWHRGFGEGLLGRSALERR